jgi:uncharacterized membrane protein YqaE (UPF0057 family)
MDILKVIFAVILPPVAAFLQVGFSLHFFLNIVLTLFGYIPGLVHALWLVFTDRQP